MTQYRVQMLMLEDGWVDALRRLDQNLDVHFSTFTSAEEARIAAELHRRGFFFDRPQEAPANWMEHPLVLGNAFRVIETDTEKEILRSM